MTKLPNITLQRTRARAARLAAERTRFAAVKVRDERRIEACSGVGAHRSCSSHRKRRSLQLRRLIMLISVGWVPPYWCPSRRLLRSRGEGRGLITRSKIAPIPGPPLRRWLEIVVNVPGLSLPGGGRPSGGHRHEARDRPPEGGYLAGNGHDDLVDVLASRRQLHRLQSRTCAFQPMAWTSAGSFSNRSWRCRLIATVMSAG